MAEWVVAEYTPEMDVDGGAGEQDAPVVIRTTEDILAYIQRRNPGIVPFECEGRTCVKVQDLLMAVCNVKEGAAKMAKSRLVEKNPELCERLIMTKKIGRYDTPVITLEGALELLLTIKSDLKGCMVRAAAKDAVDVMAGAPGMVDRVKRNAGDARREGLRQSCENRDASGDGDIRMDDGGAALPEMDPIEHMLREADAISRRTRARREECDMEVWMMHTPEYRQMREIQEANHRDRMRIRALRDAETDPDIQKALAEEFILACKRCAYPSIPTPERPESDYMTVEEMLRALPNADTAMRHATAVGRMMANEYRKNHAQQDPPVRLMPNGQRYKKYLVSDRVHLDYFVKEAELQASRPADLARGQQTVLQHFSQE